MDPKFERKSMMRNGLFTYPQRLFLQDTVNYKGEDIEKHGRQHLNQMIEVNIITIQQISIMCLLI